MAHHAGHPAPEGRTLLERDSELSAMERSLALLCGARDAGTGAVADPVGARTGGVLAFAGAPGAGKTALLAETGARAVARGCTVLRARGGEQERESAFHIVRQLVRPLLAGADESAHREILGGEYDSVAPAVGLAARGTPVSPDPQGVREGLDRVVTRFAVRHAPLVVLVDDAHWADPASSAWLAGFAPRAAELPLLIATGHRADEGPADAAGFLRAVERESVRPHALAPLSAHAVAGLVKESLGDDADTAFCRECWTVTGGNPFAVTELVALWRDSGAAPRQDHLPLLRELAAAVTGDGLIDRLQSLGLTCVRLCWAVAVLGAGATLRLAAGVAALGAQEARHAARRLRAARVLADPRSRGAHAGATGGGTGAEPGAVGGAGPRASWGTGGPGATWGTAGPGAPRGTDDGDELLEFHHPSLGTAIYRAISDSLRTALHGQAAASVAAAGRGPTASARHLLEIHPDGDPAVVGELRRAAREHLRAGAPEAAHRCLGRALREPPSLEERPRVLYELGCSALVHTPAATVHHLRAALAEPALDPTLRVLVVLRLAQALARTDRPGEAARTVGPEAERATDSRPQPRVRERPFKWSALSTDEADGPARSRRLASLVDRPGGHGTTERHLHGLRAWDAMVCGEPAATALAHAERALGDGLSWTDEEGGFEAPILVALTFLCCDRPGRAEELVAGGIAACEREGRRGARLALGLSLLGHVRHRRGRLAEAEELARAGLRIADHHGGGVPARWFALGVLIEALLARGEVDEAAGIAERSSYGDVPPDALVHPDPGTVHAELLLARGLRAEAENRLTAVGARLESRRAHNPAWCPWQLRRAEALAPTEPARAARTAREAVERARRFGTPSAIGQALHTSALVTAGAARLAQLREAVSHLERSPAAYELACALVALGAELRGAGLFAEAADRLRRGLEGAVRCGAPTLAARARDELAAARLPALRPSDDDSETLTPQERTAAGWAAAGTRVADIARGADLSEAAVRLLLSHVCRKLGTDLAGLPETLARTERHAPDLCAVRGD